MLKVIRLRPDMWPDVRGHPPAPGGPVGHAAHPVRHSALSCPGGQPSASASSLVTVFQLRMVTTSPFLTGKAASTLESVVPRGVQK